MELVCITSGYLSPYHHRSILYLHLGGEIAHCYLSEHVLRQFGFLQHIPRSPLTVGDVDLAYIDARWICFVDHVLKGVLLELSPHACGDNYLQWFRQISHMYIIRGSHDNRPSLVPRLRRHVPDDLPS